MTWCGGVSSLQREWRSRLSCDIMNVFTEVDRAGCDSPPPPPSPSLLPPVWNKISRIKRVTLTNYAGPSHLPPPKLSQDRHRDTGCIKWDHLTRWPAVTSPDQPAGSVGIISRENDTQSVVITHLRLNWARQTTLSFMVQSELKQINDVTFNARGSQWSCPSKKCTIMTSRKFSLTPFLNLPRHVNISKL